MSKRYYGNQGNYAGSDRRVQARQGAYRRPNMDAAAAAINRYRSGRLAQFYRPRTMAIPRNPGIEIKGMDTDLGTAISALIATTTTNADIICLNLVQQGAGSWNRVGRKTHLKSVRIKGTIYINTVAAAAFISNAVIRLALVWDKQPTGVTPVFSDIFGTTDQTGTEASNVLAPPRYDNMDRFKVIRDWLYDCNTLNQALSTDTARRYISIDEYVKLPNLESVYSGQSSPMTIADVSSGALYLVARMNNTDIIANAGPPLWARIRYVD